MQSIDPLMDTVACKISKPKQKEGAFSFSNIDLKYAYSQLSLQKDTKFYKLTSWNELQQEHIDSSRKSID